MGHRDRRRDRDPLGRAGGRRATHRDCSLIRRDAKVRIALVEPRAATPRRPVLWLRAAPARAGRALRSFDLRSSKLNHDAYFGMAVIMSERASLRCWR